MSGNSDIGSNNNMNDRPVFVLQQQQDDDDDNHNRQAANIFLYGSAADLGALRVADATARNTFLQERGVVLTTGGGESMIAERECVLTYSPNNTSIQQEGDEEEDHANTTKSTATTNVKGLLWITPTQILFAALSSTRNNQEDNTAVAEHYDDFVIGARCIQLHAVASAASMEEEDTEENAIYLQIGLDSNDFQGEIFLKPLLDNDQEWLDQVFQEICQLVSNYPLLEEDEEGEMGGLGMMMGMMTGNNMAHGNGHAPQDNDDDDDNDDLYWEPTTTASRSSSPGASPTERQAMLDRLDDMLVVPPELLEEQQEHVPGQFDDASENNNGADDQVMYREEDQFADAEEEE